MLCLVAPCLCDCITPARRVVVTAEGRLLDDYLRRLAGFGYSGAVLVSVNGQVVLRKGYGEADRERRLPVRPDTCFDIGSLSKWFTAAAVLRLEADGKLKVEDRLASFVPGVPEDKRGITLHQLLTHTAGVRGPDRGYREISKAEALREILNTPLAFAPGSDWAYSNAGYVLLAAVIESASGTSYREFMRRTVFPAAGLRSTGFWGRDGIVVSACRPARGYDELGPVTDLERLSGDTWNDIGSGQIVSTVEDLYRWQESLVAGRIIPDAQLKKMFTSVRREEPSDDYYNRSYGYGVWAQTLADGTSRIQHGGDFLGFGSQLTWLPERRIVIASLCNVRNDLYPVHRRADRALTRMLTGADVPEPPRFVELPAEQTARFLGTYRLAGGDTLTIDRDRQGLTVGARGPESTLLLDGHFDQAEQFRAIGETTARLVTALLHGDTTGLAAVGLGDREAQAEILEELATLRAGRGAFKRASAVGAYVGGLLGKSVDALVVLEFEGGESHYMWQWDGAHVIGTTTRCPRLAATTRVQARSSRELVGWNVVTTREFRMRFSDDGSAVVVTSGDRTATAQRVP